MEGEEATFTFQHIILMLLGAIVIIAILVFAFGVNNKMCEMLTWAC